MLVRGACGSLNCLCLLSHVEGSWSYWGRTEKEPVTLLGEGDEAPKVLVDVAPTSATFSSGKASSALFEQKA